MATIQSLKPAHRQLLVVLLVAAIVPAGLTAWLAWRLLDQDRIIANEQLRNIRERRSDEVVQKLSSVLATLAREALTLPPGSILPLDEPPAFAAQPRLLPEAPAEVFSSGEQEEFRLGRSGEAITAYKKLTASTSAAIRAGAWLRIARTYRKLGMYEEAVQAGRQLCGIPDSAAGGAPAPVAGQWIICLICQETRRLQQLKAEGEVLRRLLDFNRSVLSRDVYEAYAEDASRWSGQPRPVVSEALADAASSRPAGTGAAQFRGQWITWITVENRTVLLAPGRAARMLPSSPVQVRFATQAAPGESLRRAEETGLPWSLAIALTDSPKELTSFAVRRELLVSLLALVTALGTGASYLAWRLVQRELALTRMQSDILAAVSHEFRTPLTSMRQISAALSEGRVSGDARRQMYYDALSRATSRLHGLVETLLDFSRMESQAMPFRMESIDLSALTSRAVADFETETASGGFTLHTDVPSEEIPITGDAEALRRALWNLMENAFKYSGGSREAWVRLFRNGKEAALSVIDRGIGIPRGEQRDIFRKFFRGAAALESNTRGSGIGLSMVRHIVRAHHGRVTLESQPGAGSTFTMYLPLED